MCGLAARGLWIEMIAIMHEATPYGHLVIDGKALSAANLGKLVGVPARETSRLLKELGDAGVFSRTEGGAIFSRKMIRDHAKAEADRLNGKRGGNPALGITGGLTPPDNPAPNPPDNGRHNDTDKARAIAIQKKEERETERGYPSAVASSTPPRARDADERYHDRCLAAAGIDPAKDVTGKWAGSDQRWRTGRWLTDLGLTEAEALGVIRERRPRKPPGSMAYFDGAMQDAAGRKAAGPLAPNPPARAGSSVVPLPPFDLEAFKRNNQDLAG
jgi:hypothetical protein